MNLQTEIEATCGQAVSKVRRYQPQRWTLTALREATATSGICDTPERVAAYYDANIRTDPYVQTETETFSVLLLNTRRHIKGHVVVSSGTLDTLIVHPREVFRPAIVANAAAIILVHNHPSGDPVASEQDIKVTRDLIRAGQLLKIDVLDHVIMGTTAPERARAWNSLRECGYFYS